MVGQVVAGRPSIWGGARRATPQGGAGGDVWFCDPHSPWRRGQVKNLNRQWRFWFSRGTDLAGVEPQHAAHVASIINGQRRRSLGYQGPAALYAAAAVQ